MVYDGQSLNQTPNFQSNFPTQVGYSFPGHPFFVVAVGGASWNTLAGTAATRVDPVSRLGRRPTLVMTGGQQDLVDGDSAIQLLSDMETYAAARRGGGYQKIVATTIPHSTAYSGGQNTTRLALNTALKLSTAFDAVADVAAAPEMQDASNVTYFSDGVHPTAAGAAVIAAVVAPVLAAL